jgi:hypothetical protein
MKTSRPGEPTNRAQPETLNLEPRTEIGISRPGLFSMGIYGVLRFRIRVKDNHDESERGHRNIRQGKSYFPVAFIQVNA